ncbi:hypothetical protein LEP1GSC047_0423 [Leptospira inadai serovar Lyme str. 10]|uniref:Uncharacterized protein n=1 Tax=Leptospira inadai serovar Lyme str. 10 TaxID=1049790 RepID=V6HHR2_9LEPT|nr:hypothetical protein LEP1GSC047_0423 [Leptospira inadai serovar Lyme str. 10]
MFDVCSAKFAKLFCNKFLGFRLFIFRLEVSVLLTYLTGKLDDLSHGGFLFAKINPKPKKGIFEPKMTLPRRFQGCISNKKKVG